MTGFTKAEGKVLALAVAAKGGSGWFHPPRRLVRYAAELAARGYLDWRGDGGGALYRIKAQELDGPRDPAPPVLAVGAGAAECAALACAMARVWPLPFCERHWSALPERQRHGYLAGAFSLDLLIIELGGREQRIGVRF